MNLPLLSVAIKYEQDVVAARQRARQLAGLLGFDTQDQTRIATAVSEIARNAFVYAHGGRVEFRLEGNTPPQVLLVHITDQGPGIAQLERVLSGEYHSPGGVGRGILGARRLMDQFHMESRAGAGVEVWLRKLCPAHTQLITPQSVGRISGALLAQRPQDPVQEIQQQNQELLRTLDELRQRQEELESLNQELEDTNRGVVALYAELDERADYLRQADELKTRFLSNMSHEFRTPLNSILALSRLLLDRIDGELSAEQAKQVTFIRKAAEDLTDLVNDLLDLAKVQAGKIVVRPTEFEAAGLFGALRGMLRPLLINDALNLVFEEPTDIPPLYTDEGKVSQILRNFISNALKYTERGEVRVAVSLSSDHNSVSFDVSDTGIGIAPEDRERIFQEFAQLEHPLQTRVKGTGLGLPLSKKLAELLGGTIGVQSTVGAGSKFSLVLPRIYQEARPVQETVVPARGPADMRLPVMVVEDEPAEQLLYERFLKDTGYVTVPARTLREAREQLKQLRPAAIVLDILLKGEDSWAFLAEVKRNPANQKLPVIVVTTLADPHKALGLGADGYLLKPVEREAVLGLLDGLVQPAPREHVLMIDDDASARYVLSSLLRGSLFQVLEADSGVEGLRVARETAPSAILLDLIMPQMDGFELLAQLKADPATHAIPVIVITSKSLSEGEQQQLAAAGARILRKEFATLPDARNVLSDTLAAALRARRAGRAEAAAMQPSEAR